MRRSGGDTTRRPGTRDHWWPPTDGEQAQPVAVLAESAVVGRGRVTRSAALRLRGDVRLARGIMGTVDGHDRNESRGVLRGLPDVRSRCPGLSRSSLSPSSGDGRGCWIAAVVLHRRNKSVDGPRLTCECPRRSVNTRDPCRSYITGVVEAVIWNRRSAGCSVVI